MEQPNDPIMITENIFISTQDGKLITTQDGKCLVTQQITHTVDGQFTEAIDLSVSRDGAESFGNSVRQYMNKTGNKKSRMIFQRLGQANDLTPMFRFIGYGRFVVFDGICEAYT